ncbi:T9SS type A sorting domain-containing protein [Spirosoma spitsbergense]|uniref:T9SS type A sorting domain-containing protein n=1 Tax=Spirosoma spitsbergense TaxID=431554 RepID=UPI00047685CB|nr:T9SS type A sorting domain-containing protein [Spirosoma spitsbergense]
MKTFSISLLLWLGCMVVQAQDTPILSSNEVRYMITREPATGVFTTWVVPNYSTPNANNPESNDLGATAQFSLKVPKDFVLTDIHDIRGNWDKAAYKLTTPDAFAKTGADAGWAYYVIGKAPQETNYGPFTAGNPVALFTFRGTGGDPTQINILSPDDSFARFADQEMALNVRSSFYTRSGQRASITAKPLEQMNGVISLKKVLKDKQEQMGLPINTDDDLAQLSVIVYPNPTTDVVQVTYFSPDDQAAVSLDVLDANSMARRNSVQPAKAGLNTVQLKVGDLPGGVYFVQMLMQGKTVNKKIIKQ